jgi:hypothetical protein
VPRGFVVRELGNMVGIEDLYDSLFRGNVAEVKVVLASVVTALAVYQVALMAVGYGKVRPPFLGADPASATHRAIGDTIVLVTLVVAGACLAYYGFDDDGGAHAIFGTALLAVLAVKIAVVRWGGRISRLLPLLGLTVFTLFAVTWATSAGSFLFGD